MKGTSMPEQIVDEDWFDVLEPPFHVLDCGEFGACISDNYGRTLMFEHRNEAFVDELCKVMNENKERLVDAWKRKERR